MADGRKGPATPLSTPAPGSGKKLTKNRADDEATIKVASKKDAKDKPNGIIKLKKPPPKHKLPGNWKEGSFIDSKSGPRSVRNVATYPSLFVPHISDI
jgi:SAGA-associated factor 73